MNSPAQSPSLNNKNNDTIINMDISENTKLLDPDLFKIGDHLLDRNITEASAIDNNWTVENSSTIKKWNSTMITFMNKYKYSVIKYEKIRNILLLIPLIINGIIMIMNFLQVSTNSLSSKIGESNVILINIVFCILNFMFATLITLIVSLVKVRKYDRKIDTLTKLIERIYGFNRIIETELSLAPNMRIDANRFLKKYANYYSTLLDIDINFSLEDLQF